jgi:hypothetical protein
LLPHSPPLPTGATIEAATSIVRVTFDRNLQTGTTAVLNWTIKANIGVGNQVFTPTAPGSVLGPLVTLPTLGGGLAFPPMGVTYNAVPPDLVGSNGVPVAAFLDLPIVVV